MDRMAFDELKDWMQRPYRKPLVVRGARQVGKTFLIRQFGNSCFRNMIELNFEKHPDLASLFSSNEAARIIQLLELQNGQAITPGTTLLFLDEIQAAPQVIETLRYFYEEQPDLHVIAAGSLLEFALEAPSFAVPVGRIEYMYLGPLQFEEYLLAKGEARLLAYIQTFDFNETVPPSLHEKLMTLVKEFMIVGGMPASIRAFAETASLLAVEAEKQSILETFIDDFGKYAGKTDPERLRKVFTRIPLLIGQRLKYVNIDRHDQARNLSHALTLLCRALVIFRIHHTSGNGIPLRAEIEETSYKPLFLDVGLMCSACGLNLLDFETATDLLQINQGSICEQFAGQHLLYSQPSFVKPELFFWMRENRSSNAEVDYVIGSGPRIIPIEVKAGKTGTLKSLQLFLATKDYTTGVRINAAVPTHHTATYALPGMTSKTFELLSIPFYMIGQLKRLLTVL